jgi:hypothetical protein
MKTRSTVFAILTGLTLGTAGTLLAQQAAPPPPPPFMDALAAQGTWRNEPNYGWYWRPFEADRTTVWRPYLSGGYWQWIVDSWHWTSDYVWGGTVFHYGRWANVAEKGGWIWIPGDAFSPAWVHWVKTSDGYWGWAPLPPAPGFAPGFTLSLQFQPTDFMYVAEGQLSRRGLESVAFAGGQPAAQPMVAPQVVQVPAPMMVAPPVYVTSPTYYASPVIIREETRYVGPSIWWSYSTCSHCGGRHGGDCRGGRGYGGYGYDDHGHGGGNNNHYPRIVPVPTYGPTPRPQPYQGVVTRPTPQPQAAPVRATTTTAPSLRSAPPTVAPSRRAAGVQNILEGRR